MTYHAVARGNDCLYQCQSNCGALTPSGITFLLRECTLNVSIFCTCIEVRYMMATQQLFNCDSGLEVKADTREYWGSCHRFSVLWATLIIAGFVSWKNTCKPWVRLTYISGHNALYLELSVWNAISDYDVYCCLTSSCSALPYLR